MNVCKGFTRACWEVDAETISWIFGMTLLAMVIVLLVPSLTSYGAQKTDTATCIYVQENLKEHSTS